MKITKNTMKSGNIFQIEIPVEILIICGSRSRKTNAFLDLTSQQDDIDKIYLYA